MRFKKNLNLNFSPFRKKDIRDDWSFPGLRWSLKTLFPPHSAVRYDTKSYLVPGFEPPAPAFPIQRLNVVPRKVPTWQVSCNYRHYCLALLSRPKLDHHGLQNKLQLDTIRSDEWDLSALFGTRRERGREKGETY